jgi:hypothetical protein
MLGSSPPAGGILLRAPPAVGSRCRIGPASGLDRVDVVSVLSKGPRPAAGGDVARMWVTCV